MRSSCKWGIGLMALLAGLVIMSSAAQTAPPREAKKREKAELVTELKAAHKLLVEANRDYDGHRARAAEEVHKAIKELGGKHHSTRVRPGSPVVPPAAGPGHPKLPKVHEAQANSDSQLREAHAILRGLEAELGAHHSKAAANVAAAIAEIKTALKIN